MKTGRRNYSYVYYSQKKITWEKMFIIKDNLDKRKKLREHAASGN